MRLVQTALRKLEELLPSKITHVEWQDPTLILHGTGWRLVVLSSWRVIRNGVFVLGFEDQFTSDDLAKLLNCDVVRCIPQTSTATLDMTLVFSNGMLLETFSCTPIEPWILYLNNDPEEIIVASPSDPEL